jgi:hypothetical protein
MLKFLYKINDGKRVPALPKAAPLLPSPDDATTPETRALLSSVNKHVNKETIRHKIITFTNTNLQNRQNLTI